MARHSGQVGASPSELYSAGSRRAGGRFSDCEAALVSQGNTGARVGTQTAGCIRGRGREATDGGGSQEVSGLAEYDLPPECRDENLCGRRMNRAAQLSDCAEGGPLLEVPRRSQNIAMHHQETPE